MDVTISWQASRSSLSSGAKPPSAGPRIGRALDEATAKLDPLPGIITDRARLRVMLASLARTFHVGPLSDCFFDPATALCLKKVTANEAGQPLIALCEPTRCPNACIAARHRSIWERSANEARALLREKRLSGLQRGTLKRELDRITDVLVQITPDGAPPSERAAPKERGRG
jgi:hypothetical protein